VGNTLTRIVIDEVLTTLKQTFDDKNITRAQAAFWVITVGNDLLAKHIGKRDSGLYLTTYPEVPISIAKNNNTLNIVKNRKYVELPDIIFSYDKDGGIKYMSYESTGGPGCPPRFTTIQIDRTTPKEALWLNKSVYTRPSPKNPYFYLSGNIVYFLGLEKVPVKNIEMGLFSPIKPVEQIDIDTPFPLPSELLPQLKINVINLARFSFFLPQTDVKNDGSATSGQANIGKVQSVNQPQSQDE